MSESKKILDILLQILQSGQKAVLATVIRTSGSTYRKEGAKMIITEAGELIGNISAGCLENDVREVALEMLKTNQPKRLVYDNTSKEEIIWGLGLGCNGIVEVFVEPVS